MAARTRRIVFRIVLLLGSTAVFLVAAELLYRQFGPSRTDGNLFYADADRREVDLETADGLVRAQAVVEVVPDAPRFRMRFKPDVLVYLCYRGYEGRGDFDAHGCVPFRTNSWGVRDREELCTPKPDGQRRVVCLGDSTTVGWGVPIEKAWTRLVEGILRVDDDGLRVVNCGASGTLVPDEYAHALETRFVKFEPDLVLVTLCVNDLLPVNGAMVHFEPAALAAVARPVVWPLSLSRVATDMVRASRQTDALWLEPARDWVGELIALPLERYPQGPKEMGFIYWGSGNPQTALRRMHAWCEERGIRFAVELWPFLQQLGSREEHPFASIHERVREFCAAEGIPFLDLLDVFLGQDASSLWLTPRDQHGNARAHAMAAPAMAAFVADLLGS